jgi:biopolymer transport protein ExbD
MKLERKPSEAEIPTASMADITFMLIIFFILTAAFADTKGIDFRVPPPADEPAPNTERIDSILVRVSPEGIEYDGKPWRPENCTWRQREERRWSECDEANKFYQHLRDKLGNNPKMPVILYVRPEAPYEKMVLAYDVLSYAEDKDAVGIKPKLTIPTQADVEAYIRAFGTNPFDIEYAAGG